MSPRPPVTRFAPSPTGYLHVGNYRTALFSWLHARGQGGQFILRIEDTDQERSKQEYEMAIRDSLEWLQLDYDEEYRQSERRDIHREYLQKIVNDGTAYTSYEKGDDGTEREIIRFRNPNRSITFQDQIRGDVTFDTTELGDFVIAKSFDEPLFHLAVVVDDAEMGITNVIRGEDHISNTPRQILIYEALGWEPPTYAHIPLVLTPEREKLSKRTGAKSVLEYREEGFLPNGLVNYMALLGWNPGTDEEIFDRRDLIAHFDIMQVHKGGAVFDEEKLRWVNREHLKRIEIEDHYGKIHEFLERSERLRKNRWEVPADLIPRVTPLFIERIETYGDVTALADDGEIDFIFAEPAHDPEQLVWKKTRERTGDEASARTEAKRHLTFVHETLSAQDHEDFTPERVKEALWEYASQEGRGDVLWPLRVALTGKDKSPDPFSVASLIGRDETLKRLDNAIATLT